MIRNVDNGASAAELFAEHFLVNEVIFYKEDVII